MNKILPTIGPKTENVGDIKKILKFSKILRINGSHGKLLWHEKISTRIKNIDREAKILLDIPGVKPRTDNNIDIEIKRNELICFYYKNKSNSTIKHIKITNPLPEISSKCKYFTISDGQYRLKLVKSNKNYVIGKAEERFLLRPKKGLNVPFSIYDDRRQTLKFIEFLKKAKKVRHDAIGLSFIQNSSVLKLIKKKYPKQVIVSKIENLIGLNNSEDIIKNSDTVMIDRGDLGAEIGDKNLFNAILHISELCKKHGKSLIIATENLESMIHRISPTKSEIVSLGHSLSINADKIMLSDETATSDNWLQILNWLNDFIDQNSPEIIKNKSIQSNIFWEMVGTVSDIPIILFSRQGYAFEHISAINPNIELSVFTDNPKTATRCMFRANTKIYFTKKFDLSGRNSHISVNIKKNLNSIFKSSNNALLIYISYPRNKSRANTVSLVTKIDFI